MKLDLGMASFHYANSLKAALLPADAILFMPSGFTRRK